MQPVPCTLGRMCRTLPSGPDQCLVLLELPRCSSLQYLASLLTVRRLVGDWVWAHHRCAACDQRCVLLGKGGRFAASRWWVWYKTPTGWRLLLQSKGKGTVTSLYRA